MPKIDRRIYIAQSKMELFRNKKPIYCEKHGTHFRWREARPSNVSCLMCRAEWTKRKRVLDPIPFMLRDARGHAKKKGIAFDLSKNDILELLAKQKNKCALSGIDFKVEMYSLDKINPSGNYTKDNIQLLTISVNRMKSNFSQDIFVMLCKSIAEHYGLEPRLGDL